MDLLTASDFLEHRQPPRFVKRSVHVASDFFLGEEREAFKKALVIYYSGTRSIREAFSQVEPGLIDRYYRRKKKYPRDVGAINSQAQRIAQKKRAELEMAFESYILRASFKLQRKAAESLLDLLPEILRIAGGEHRVVYDAVQGKEKTIIVYPRDQLDAVKFLHTLARIGVLPESYEPARPETVDTRETAQYCPPLPLVSPPADLKTVSAVRPEGMLFTVEVEPKDGGNNGDVKVSGE